MDPYIAAKIDAHLAPGFGRLHQAVGAAKLALIGAEVKSVIILDGSQLSPSWRALPEAQGALDLYGDEAAEVIGELFDEFERHHPNTHWEDGELRVTVQEDEENDELQSTDGVTYEVFVAPQRVGWKATRGEDVEYVYLAPSTETDDGVPNVFLYSGRTGDPALDAPEVHVTHFGPEPKPLIATPANMRALEAEGTRVFSYSPTTNERYSATAGDYFQLSDNTPLRDEEGDPMILARERCEIVPYTNTNIATANDSRRD